MFLTITREIMKHIDSTQLHQGKTPNCTRVTINAFPKDSPNDAQGYVCC